MRPAKTYEQPLCCKAPTVAEAQPLAECALCQSATQGTNRVSLACTSCGPPPFPSIPGVRPLLPGMCTRPDLLAKHPGSIANNCGLYVQQAAGGQHINTLQARPRFMSWISCPQGDGQVWVDRHATSSGRLPICNTQSTPMHWQAFHTLLWQSAGRLLSPCPHKPIM